MTVKVPNIVPINGSSVCLALLSASFAHEGCVTLVTLNRNSCSCHMSPGDFDADFHLHPRTTERMRL